MRLQTRLRTPTLVRGLFIGWLGRCCLLCGSFEAFPGGLLDDLFPNHQGAGERQPHPQGFNRIDLVQPVF
jgi:hypothetical protein